MRCEQAFGVRDLVRFIQCCYGRGLGSGLGQISGRPHVASLTWSSTEQVAQPATKRFHTSDWRPLETCCRPWTWWCNDATALAGYATVMMMMGSGTGGADVIEGNFGGVWRGGEKSVIPCPEVDRLQAVSCQLAAARSWLAGVG